MDSFLLIVNQGSNLGIITQSMAFGLQHTPGNRLIHALHSLEKTISPGSLNCRERSHSASGLRLRLEATMRDVTRCPFRKRRCCRSSHEKAHATQSYLLCNSDS